MVSIFVCEIKNEFDDSMNILLGARDQSTKLSAGAAEASRIKEGRGI